MRRRALSDEGLQLYLHGATPTRPRHWTRKLVCSLFHSHYDDHLYDVVCKCRASTQALAAQFHRPEMRERLDAAILHTIRIILTRDHKKVKKRHVVRSVRFFTDVMDHAYRRHDHQTAHMLYLALTHPAIANLKLKPRRNDSELLARVGQTYGEPTYQKHVHFWRGVRSDHVLPSLIAFHIFVTRRDFAGRHDQAREAREMMDIFQYLEHDPRAILPLYSQARLTDTQVHTLSRKFI